MLLLKPEYKPTFLCKDLETNPRLDTNIPITFYNSISAIIHAHLVFDHNPFFTVMNVIVGYFISVNLMHLPVHFINTFLNIYFK